MATTPAPVWDEWCRDLGISQETVRHGVVRGTRQRADRHWRMWEAYCDELGVDPLLTGIDDPIPFLQVFATRYRRRLGPTGKPVRSSTVADAIRSVGQTMASLGASDIRLQTSGKLDFRLSRMFRAYSREDPPPNRVKPIPMAVIRHIAQASTLGDAAVQAISDMVIIAFFYLLRPGEYTGTSNDDTPFRLQDVQLFKNGQRLDLFTARADDILSAHSASLTFTTQKNGVRGEVVNHGRSGDPLVCPVLAIARRILHLRANQARPDTILAAYFRGGRRLLVQASDITLALRTASEHVGPQLGYLPSDVSARSLRAGGAMALFCSDVDSDTIQLLGRWQSDSMLRYLHLQAQPVMQGFARRMLTGGDYALHPNQTVPMY